MHCIDEKCTLKNASRQRLKVVKLDQNINAVNTSRKALLIAEAKKIRQMLGDIAFGQSALPAYAV